MLQRLETSVTGVLAPNELKNREVFGSKPLYHWNYLDISSISEVMDDFPSPIPPYENINIIHIVIYELVGEK